MPQMKETILLWVPWSIVRRLRIAECSARKNGDDTDPPLAPVSLFLPFVFAMESLIASCSRSVGGTGAKR